VNEQKGLFQFVLQFLHLQLEKVIASTKSDKLVLKLPILFGHAIQNHIFLQKPQLKIFDTRRVTVLRLPSGFQHRTEACNLLLQADQLFLLITIGKEDCFQLLLQLNTLDTKQFSPLSACRDLLLEGIFFATDTGKVMAELIQLGNSGRLLKLQFLHTPLVIVPALLGLGQHLRPHTQQVLQLSRALLQGSLFATHPGEVLAQLIQLGSSRRLLKLQFLRTPLVVVQALLGLGQHLRPHTQQVLQLSRALLQGFLLSTHPGEVMAQLIQLGSSRRLLKLQFLRTPLVLVPALLGLGQRLCSHTELLFEFSRALLLGIDGFLSRANPGPQLIILDETI
jgi:fumarate reductase subunit C